MVVARRKSREVRIGEVTVGGCNPIAIQSMTNTYTHDIESTVQQIDELTEYGCEIVRVAVPDIDSAKAISRIRKRISIPLVADIHFKADLAIASIDNGADKIRINPGNIANRETLCGIIDRARSAGIAIRIGINTGSLERDILAEYGRDNPEALVKSAVRWIDFFEEHEFEDLVVSIKSSAPAVLIESNRKLAAECDYPLHIGLTEAGPPLLGAIRSTVALVPLLQAGIGDTVRISLAGDPIEEIRAARELLRSLGIRNEGVCIIACPTCGRLEVDLLSLVEKVERITASIRTPMTIAVMGCTVNGPGEVMGADIGVIGGHDKMILSRNGKTVAAFKPNELESALIREIEDFVYSSS